MFAPVRGGIGTLNNFAATVPPAVTNDVTQGYVIGSRWFDNTDGVMWLCRSATANAAVWTPDAAHPGYITGRYYPIFGGNTSTNNIAANIIYMMPFIPEFDISVQDMAVWLVVGTGATGAKGAIYANKYSGTGKARAFGAPLSADNTGQATTATGAKVTFPVTAALKKGIAYWCGMKVDSGTPTYTCAGTTSLNGARFIGKSDVTSSNMVAVTTPHAYATDWPTFNGSETWADANTCIVMNLKA